VVEPISSTAVVVHAGKVVTKVVIRLALARYSDEPRREVKKAIIGGALGGVVLLMSEAVANAKEKTGDVFNEHVGENLGQAFDAGVEMVKDIYDALS
jgi:hypothetical protein